jgi:hypothetical protein
MKRRLISPLLILAALLAACAPATASPEPAAPATQPPAASPATMAPPAATTLDAATEPPLAEATALPVATSRGPELHATDPTTVSLASGGLHFVEFFRFT